MRTLALLLILLLQGCALAELREELDEFHANPEHSGLHAYEPYDPAKVPVLFIHGAGGSKGNWRRFIDRLDRTRYQPWAYTYPTGLPIEASAARLNQIVSQLHTTYRFRRLVVVGHSMGGLVGRRFIALNGRPYARELITFATPWDGVPIARMGATLGRFALPSWNDLVPGSVLLRTVQADDLALEVKHHIFFGYRERGDPYDSDGVISVASQREEHVEAQAWGVHGFKTDHSGIIDDPEVFRRFAALLAGFN
jgi:pimeloyl-ACP methyl ester carboxylesterase